MHNIPPDIQRILEVPIEYDQDVNVERISTQFRLPTGTQTLRPIQAKMLTKAKQAGGLVALVACGEGKTLTTLLLPVVLGAKRPLLLLPASMRAQHASDRIEYGQHWDTPPMDVMSYEGLSSPAQIERLQELKPDLVIADEAHLLKNLKSARVRRLEAYLMRSGASFCALSGTLVSRSLTEYAHLLNWALKIWSPLPRENQYIRDFALWVEEHQASPRVISWFKALESRFDLPETKRKEATIHQRLRTSRGVVITASEQVGASLYCYERKISVPDSLKDAITHALDTGSVVSAASDILDVDTLDSLWESRELWTPDDSVASRACAQLVCGFLYVWDWGSRGEDKEWIFARRAWGVAVRYCLAHGWDSPALLERAIRSGKADVHPWIIDDFNAWEAVRHRPPPMTRAVWLDEYLIDDVVQWVEQQKEPPIIWCQLGALAKRIAQRLDCPLYGGGSEASKRLEANKKKAHTCVASISAHGTGKNLQAWGNQIVVHPLAHPARWEQMLARTHRKGQLRDTVSATVYTHGLFGRAFNKAKKDADYIYETTGQNQRLRYMDRIKVKK